MNHVNEAEILIAHLMASRSMSREEAATALVTKDSRERNFGRKPVVDGTPLAVIYADEMSGELTEDQAVKVVAYLHDLSEDDARQDLKRRVQSGLIHFETKH